METKSLTDITDLIRFVFSISVAVGISQYQFSAASVFSILYLRQYLHNKDAGNYNASDKETQNANEAEHILVTR